MIKLNLNRRVINLAGSFWLTLIIALLFFLVIPMAAQPAPVRGNYTSSGSATGLGTPINDKGNWFMYNTYNGGTATYSVQLGNPKNGQDIIGSYTVTANANGTYTVNYNLNGVKVDSALLTVSSSPNFTGKPGKDANAQFGAPISVPGNGPIYIFAHFSVEY